MSIEPRAFYNEIDDFAADWLEQLIAAGAIMNGVVCRKPIQEVQARDLEGFTRCHFFAGIGGWDLALQLADWPDEVPVWTGSCPCQPFSTAGKQKGKKDERHLWPEMQRLISQCKPATFFGEQVSSAVTHGWLDDVYEGLEAEGYAVGAAVLPACSVGAPHKRDRLWFVGNAKHDGQPAAAFARSEGKAVCNDAQGENSASEFERASCASHVADTCGKRFCCEENKQELCTQRRGELDAGQPRSMGAMADTKRIYAQRRKDRQEKGQPWGSGVWLECPDGKARLVEPSIHLLANGVSNRVGKLRGYGNAIVSQTAAAFIKAFMEVK